MSKKLVRGLVFVVFISLMPLITSGCGSRCKEPIRERPFKATALLLDVATFPTSWRQTSSGRISSGPLGGSMAIERFETFFDSSDALAFHQVYRYACSPQAIHEYGELRKAEYKDTPRGSDWKVPAIASTWNTFADESYLACGTSGSEQRCKAIARYEEYVVEFYSHMSSTTFSLSDLQSVLKTMDSNIGRVISK